MQNSITQHYFHLTYGTFFLTYHTSSRMVQNKDDLVQIEDLCAWEIRKRLHDKEQSKLKANSFLWWVSMFRLS